MQKIDSFYNKNWVLFKINHFNMKQNWFYFTIKNFFSFYHNSQKKRLESQEFKSKYY